MDASPEVCQLASEKYVDSAVGCYCLLRSELEFDFCFAVCRNCGCTVRGECHLVGEVLLFGFLVPCVVDKANLSHFPVTVVGNLEGGIDRLSCLYLRNILEGEGEVTSHGRQIASCLLGVVALG